MNDCRFGVSPVNYPDPDPDVTGSTVHDEFKTLARQNKNKCCAPSEDSDQPGNSHCLISFRCVLYG